jgi:hypothetical protein
MTTLQEMMQAVTSLCEADVRALREWIEEYEADLWDAQIERDVKAGKLDFLFAEGRRDYEAGLTEPL